MFESDNRTLTLAHTNAYSAHAEQVKYDKRFFTTHQELNSVLEVHY